MRPQTEFSHYTKEMANFNVQKEFCDKVFPQIEEKEPTLFYVIMQKETQSNLKCSLFSLLQSMIDKSNINQTSLHLE